MALLEMLLLIAIGMVLLFVLLRFLLGRIPVARLDQRSVLITGCDSGFGFELALRCVSERMRVFAACLTEQGVKTLQNAVEERGLSIELLEAFEMDVRSDASVTKALEFVEQKLGAGKGLHALVNNAGITGNAGWDDWLVPKDYEDAWQVNALGTIRVTQAFKRLIQRERESRIVMMASTCGRVALPSLGPYNVSKFGVEAYADTIRGELIMFGVKVSILEPGFFRTPITNLERSTAIIEQIWERTPESVKQSYGQAFYEFSRNYLLKFLDPNRLNPHTEYVVDAYWHAISSAWPRRRYQIGKDFIFAYHPLSLLPAELQDLCFLLLQYINKAPLPISSLRRRSVKLASDEIANGKALVD